jgi:hypothetical protein
LGYLGTIAILLYKTFSSNSEHESYAKFFEGAAFITSITVGASSVCAACYFQGVVAVHDDVDVAGVDDADHKEALLNEELGWPKGAR